MPSRLKTKHKAYRFGHWAEALALAYYRLLGYRPLARRFKTKLGEIDLVVASRKRIIFIEVKARRGGERIFALHPTQAERMRHAASLFLARHPRFLLYEQRLDVVFIAPWRFPIRITNMI